MGDKQMEAMSTGHSFKSFAMKAAEKQHMRVKRLSLSQKAILRHFVFW